MGLWLSIIGCVCLVTGSTGVGIGLIIGGIVLASVQVLGAALIEVAERQARQAAYDIR